MKKRGLFVLVAVVILLVFPAGSLAGAQGEVLLEGEETSAEVTASESAEPTATPAPTETATEAPTEAPSAEPTASEEQTPTITLDKHSITVYVGDPFTLNAVVTPAGHNVEWQISGPVTSDGGSAPSTFRARDVGTAKITAIVRGYPDVFDTCEVTIQKRLVTSVSVPQRSYTINIGESVEVQVTVLPTNATDKTLNWTISDYGTVKMTYLANEKRRFTGVRAGTDMVRVFTAENGNLGAFFSITVIDSSASATPRPSSATVSASEPTPSLTATEMNTPYPTRIPKEMVASDWDEAEDEISGMEAGSLGRIEAPDDPFVPVSLLETLIATQCALEIDFGEYSCIIDGADLTGIPEGISSIDISMAMEEDAAVSAACGGSAYVLRFNHQGELPGVFTFRVKAQGSRSGDTVYLYYLSEETGEFEGVHSAVVNSEGYASIRITHCSSYYLTDTIIAGAENNFELPDETAQAAGGGFTAFIENNFVTFWVTVYVLGCGVVVALFVVIFRKRKRKGEAAKQTSME